MMRMMPGKTPSVHLKLQRGETPLDAAEGVVRCLARVMRDMAEKVRNS